MSESEKEQYFVVAKVFPVHGKDGNIEGSKTEKFSGDLESTLVNIAEKFSVGLKPKDVAGLDPTKKKDNHKEHPLL